MMKYNLAQKNELHKCANKRISRYIVNTKLQKPKSEVSKQVYYDAFCKKKTPII